MTQTIMNDCSFCQGSPRRRKDSKNGVEWLSVRMVGRESAGRCRFRAKAPGNGGRSRSR